MTAQIIAVYEDGTRVECDAAEWLADNGQDTEAALAYDRMCAGWHVMLGGGAQPLCRLWMEEVQA